MRISTMVFLAGFFATLPAAADEAKKESEPLPVAVVRNGFTPEQAADLTKRFANVEAMKGGDVSLFGFLHFTEVQKTAVIPRTGAVMPLETALNPKIADVRFKSDLGDKSLAEFIADPQSRLQGVVVIHSGRIVFEQYPGMRPNDYHVWMSCTKTTSSLMLRLLEEDGLIDIKEPLTKYLPWLRGTGWEGVKVSDVLDMKTGMDVIENDASRADPDSIPMRMNLAGSGVPYKGKVEAIKEVLAAAKRAGPPGVAFEYSSVNTLLLPCLCEAVTNRRWIDLFHERVWSKMGVEGDMLMGVTPDGLAFSSGLAITRLRDLARYGMLYTPSWNKAARERIVSESYIKELMKGGDPEVYKKGGNAEKYTHQFGDAPKSNHYQWDAIFADGDMYKAGLQGQGLYVSPSRDVVVVYFSTVPRYYFPGYARAIAKAIGGAK
jgi:CubicO group peptidase (beta-lactamase class C family)